MSDWELLSRLWEGDLGGEEEARLRQRLRAEPELARQWHRMQLLGLRLAAESTERPPARLDQALLAPRPHRRAWPLAAVALAAGLLLGLFWPRPAPRLALGPGRHELEGELQLAVAGMEVDLDGAARLELQPGPPSARVQDAEVDMQWMSHLGAAGAGAALVLVVTEGSARVRGPEGEEHLVEAGQRYSQPVAEAVAEASPKGFDRAAATARMTALESELDGLRLQLALAEGRARHFEGEALPFPADLPDAYRPAAMEAFVRAELARMPEVELLRIDCSEYPCLTVLRSRSPDEDWVKQVAVIHDNLKDKGFPGEDQSVTGMGMHRQDDSEDLRLYAFTIAPSELGEEVRRRSQLRMEEAADESWTGEEEAAEQRDEELQVRP